MLIEKERISREEFESLFVENVATEENETI